MIIKEIAQASPIERKLIEYPTTSDLTAQSNPLGTDDPSIKRCLALMREECPLGKWNWYVGGYGEAL